jgi:hypothetical protein
MKHLKHLRIAIVFLLCIFIFINCHNNSWPRNPAPPVGPSTGNVNDIITFKASTTDPEGDNIAYQFDWGTDNNSSWSDFISSGDSITITHSWSDTGHYNILVRAKDIKDKASKWSESHSLFIINNTTPNIPSVPSGPDSGYVHRSYIYSTNTTDPDEDSICYKFDWGDGNTSAWSSYVQSGTSIQMNYTWSHEGIYNIRTKAKDKYGVESAWSQEQIITISPQDIPNNGLVAEYLFNGNANDVSGNENHGTLFGNASVVQNVLKIGDNKEDYISIPNTVFHGLADLTISFFIKLDKIHRVGRKPGHTVISCSREYEDNAFVIFYLYEDKAWNFWVNDRRLHFPSDTTIFDKDWHSIVVLREDGNGTLYIDGRVQTTQVNDAILNTAEGTIMIGQEQDMPHDTIQLEQDQSLAGKLDNLRLYNRALPDSEIQVLYNENH